MTRWHSTVTKTLLIIVIIVVKQLQSYIHALSFSPFLPQVGCFYHCPKFQLQVGCFWTLFLLLYFCGNLMSKNFASGELFLDLMFCYLWTIYTILSLIIVIEYFFQYYIFVNSYGLITMLQVLILDFLKILYVCIIIKSLVKRATFGYQFHYNIFMNRYCLKILLQVSCFWTFIFILVRSKSLKCIKFMF